MSQYESRYLLESLILSTTIASGYIDRMAEKDHKDVEKLEDLVKGILAEQKYELYEMPNALMHGTKSYEDLEMFLKEKVISRRSS